MEVTGWIGFGFAMVGQYLIVRKNQLAFIVWNVANLIWIYLAIVRQDWAQVAMFTAYTLFNIWGLWEWAIKVNKTE